MTLPLIIILPLIAAVLCSITSKNISWLITFITAVIILIFSLYNTIYAYHDGPISYYLGGWEPPYGIEFRIDTLNSIFLVLISAISVLTLPYGFFSVKEQIAKNKIPSFYTCFLLCLAGLLGMVISNDVFNIYVFLELFSLTSYALIAMGNKEAPNSAFEYLIIGTIGATFYLLGTGLLYMMTGTLNITDIHSKLLLLPDNQVVGLGAIFIFVGLGVKAGLFPFHQWLVGSYSNAPCYISTFFSATATKVAIYLMIRFLLSVFTNTTEINNALHILSLIAIIAGSLFALREKTILRILPYSSISQIGYIILGISLNSRLALTGAILHLIFHSIAKSSIFMLTQLERNKTISIAMLGVLSCSLIGIPLTAGFTSKWYLITAATESGSITSVIIMAIGSVLTFFYTWKTIEQVKWEGKTISNVMLLPPAASAIALLLLGIYSQPLFDLISFGVGQIL